MGGVGGRRSLGGQEREMKEKRVEKWVMRRGRGGIREQE